MSGDPDDPTKPIPFDCDSCRFGKTGPRGEWVMRANTERERAQMHCGLMPESEWRDPMILSPVPDAQVKRIAASSLGDFEGIEWNENVCPGWAVRQPLVVEVAQAYAAFEKAALESMFPDAAHVLVEGLLEMHRALGVHQKVRMTEMKNRQANG